MGKTCKYCGSTLNDGDNFCQKCGAVAESEESVKATASTQTNNTIENNVSSAVNVRKTNGAAIASLVCSLIGIFIMAIPLGTGSICFGAAALKHMKVFPNEKGKGLAIAGIVIGIIDVVLGFVSIVIRSSSL